MIGMLTCMVLGFGQVAQGKELPKPEKPAATIAALEMKEVGVIPIKIDQVGDLIPAQLDSGKAKQLLSIVVDPGEGLGLAFQKPGVSRITVLRYNGTKFEAEVKPSIPEAMSYTVAADLDQDGIDELVGLTDGNEILTLKYADGKFAVASKEKLTDRAVIGMAVANLRKQGSPDLVLLTDQRLKHRDEGTPKANLITCYRYEGGKWRKYVEQAVTQLTSMLTVMSGRFATEEGDRLVLRHDADDLSLTTYEIYKWSGSKLELAKTYQSNAFGSRGLQNWTCASSDLMGEHPSILAATLYFKKGEKGNTAEQKFELLQWVGNTPTPVASLPGVPLAVGDFNGSGRDCVLIADPAGGLKVYAPTKKA